MSRRGAPSDPGFKEEPGFSREEDAEAAREPLQLTSPSLGALGAAARWGGGKTRPGGPQPCFKFHLLSDPRCDRGYSVYLSAPGVLPCTFRVVTAHHGAVGPMKQGHARKDGELGPARGNTPCCQLSVQLLVSVPSARVHLQDRTLVCSALGLPQPGASSPRARRQGPSLPGASAATLMLRSLVPPCANVAQLRGFALGFCGDAPGRTTLSAFVFVCLID